MSRSKYEDGSVGVTGGSMASSLQTKNEEKISAAIVTSTTANKSNHSKNLTKGSIQLTEASFSSSSSSSAIDVEYYHYYGAKVDNDKGPPSFPEILFLHGAKFSKEDWLQSGILEKLCGAETDTVSCTALDLSVRANANDLILTFRTLRDNGIISGKPLFVVTPSASGNAIVTGINQQEKEQKQLLSMMKGWIPVAPGSVLSLQTKTLKEFFSLAAKQENGSLSVLAINGSKDSNGAKVTKLLVETAGEVLPANHFQQFEQEGAGHPSYLDKPDEFVEVVRSFVLPQ
eukprot:CAMPEP_0194370968 /NCGR_PEP_ID=MMETSP0174-20130528/19309_1 /TAXON_ID=216777 /ORGANISM="Proboscia alata, Strain PI-D3" /LENGTH=286 /DNA_ID=CAMNT_0039148729 /DNA_START=52 /DNA_END=912 /DNA_ORIENTATION=-